MKILVTGGMGFIGSNITERLVRDDHDVTILDNMHTGSEDNIAEIKDRIEFVKGNAGDLGKIKTDRKFDAIFHEGIYSSTPMYRADPTLTAKAIADFISILEYAKKNEAKVVWASTSSIYNGNSPPHREDMPVHVTDFYTEARFEMERLAKLYSDLYSVRSVGLRYFSVYGPHERAKGKYANLITQFLWCMQDGKKPIIFGDGKQTRDFTYVDDVVDANMLALRYNKTDIFNVGTGRSITINEMVALLNVALKTNLSPVYEQNKIKNYVQHTCAETRKAESHLGFKARVSLEDGIKRIIDYYRKV